MKKMLFLWVGVLIVLSGVVCASLSDGLKAYYSMDIDMRDSAGNLDGDDSAKEGITHTDTNCKIGGCYEFPGTDTGYLKAHDDTTNEFDQSYTVSFWAWMDKVDYDDFGIFYFFMNDYYTSATIDDHNMNIPIFSHDGIGGVDTLLYDNTPEAGKWTHYVASFDGTYFSLYKDGYLIDDGIAVTTDTMTSGFNGIGNGGDMSGQFDGRIDEFALWNRGLSSSEIQDLYNNGQGLQYPFCMDKDRDGFNDCYEDKCPDTTNEEPKEPIIYGCSCKQILDLKPGEDKGELKNGCSKGTINVFTKQIGWAKDLLK